MNSRDAKSAAGFTLVEVLVALMVVAIGLAALMAAVSGTARTSGILRDKTIAGWIALNRITEVRLNLGKNGQSNDSGEIDFANRKWHYDTRYFSTSINSMKRVVVRVYAGAANTKGNPLVETVGFTGTQIAPPGTSNTQLWTANSGPSAAAAGTTTSAAGTTTSSGSSSTLTAPAQGSGATVTPTPGSNTTGGSTTTGTNTTTTGANSGNGSTP
jgi:general secretion pathway protein I